jgi:hypothetical protein
MKSLASPIVLLARLVTGIVQLALRFVALLVGLVCVVVGAVLTITLIGAIVGVPLLATGLQLIRQGLS